MVNRLKKKQHHENKAKEFFQKLGNGIKDAWNTITEPIKTVYKDAKDLVFKGVGLVDKTANNLITSGKDVALGAENTVSSSVSSLSSALPYAVGAGVVGFGIYSYFSREPKPTETKK
jgi:hypothetical protein